MVLTSTARDDIDNICLTKTIIYRYYGNDVEDLAYDTVNTDDYVDYSIKAQATIQLMDSKYVVDGRLLEGDLVGLFRYEYVEDVHGNAIVPSLIPKKGDKIKFEGFWFTIKACTPATSEEEGIIGWDFTANQNV